MPKGDSTEKVNKMFIFLLERILKFVYLLWAAEVGLLLNSKSDLSSTTKCGQNHIIALWKFGHA